MNIRVPVTPIDVADISHYDHETDVLVIGYGCAGASAALEAAAAGSEVVLLERQSGGGGSSALSGGEMYLGGGTPIQQACGFTDTAEDMEKFLLAALGPGDPRRRSRLRSMPGAAPRPPAPSAPAGRTPVASAVVALR